MDTCWKWISSKFFIFLGILFLHCQEESFERGFAGKVTSRKRLGMPGRARRVSGSKKDGAKRETPHIRRFPDAYGAWEGCDEKNSLKGRIKGCRTPSIVGNRMNACEYRYFETGKNRANEGKKRLRAFYEDCFPWKGPWGNISIRGVPGTKRAK